MGQESYWQLLSVMGKPQMVTILKCFRFIRLALTVIAAPYGKGQTIKVEVRWIDTHISGGNWNGNTRRDVSMSDGQLRLYLQPG